MISILLGALTGLCVCAALVAGFIVGSEYRKPEKAVPEELTQEQIEHREQLIAEQKAFRTQMNFNASDVYKTFADAEE